MARGWKTKGTREGGFSRPHRHFVRKGRRGKRDFRPHIENTILVLDGPVLGLGNSEPRLSTVTGIYEVLTLNLPTTTIVAQPFNVIKWQLKFNPAT